MGSNMDKIYIVMNYVEHDLKSLMETMKQPFLPGRPACQRRACGSLAHVPEGRLTAGSPGRRQCRGGRSAGL